MHRFALLKKLFPKCVDLVVIPQILVIDVQKSQSPTFYCEKGRRQQDPNFESVLRFLAYMVFFLSYKECSRFKTTN